MLPLEVSHGTLGNEEGSLFRVDDGAHFRELPRAQEVAGIREHPSEIDGAGRHADLPVHDLGRPRVRVRRAVGERHLELALFLADRVRVAAALPPAHVLLLGDGDLDVDRVDERHSGQRRAGGDQVADVRVLDSRDAADRRGDLGPAEVELCVRHCRLRPGDLRLRLRHVGPRVEQVGLLGRDRGQVRQVILDGAVKLLLADRAARRKRRITGDVELRLLLVRLGPKEIGLGLRDLCAGLLELRFGRVERGPRLVQRNLVRPGIDLEEEVAGLDQRAFPVLLADQVAGHPRADLGGNVADRCSDPFDVDGHVPLDDRSDLDRLGSSGQ